MQGTRVTAAQRQLEAQLRELEAIAECSVRLQHLRDPEALAQEIISVLEQLLSYEYAAVLLTDVASGRLVPFALSDQGQGAQFIPRDREYLASCGVRVGSGVTGWVAAHGTSVLLGDVRSDPRYQAVRADIRSELCVPMRIRGELIGAINVETVRPDAYTELDRRVLEVIGAHIAVAIENSRLHEASQRAERLGVVADIAGGIGHDVGNLLAVIGMECSALRTRLGAEDPMQRALAVIADTATSAIALTRRLMDIERKPPARDEPVDVAGVVRRVEPLLRALAGKRAQLALQLATAGARLRGDSGEIEQILMNLTVNARDALDGEGRIEIAVDVLATPALPRLDVGAMPATPQCVQLSVSDTGSGIDPTIRSAIFNPFFTTRDNGTGLGLTTVARIVQSLGGGIAVQTSPGQGTTFRILLPHEP